MRRLVALVVLAVPSPAAAPPRRCASRRSSCAGPRAEPARAPESAARSESQVRIAIVTHGQASDPFWSIVRKGIDDAARASSTSRSTTRRRTRSTSSACGG